MKVVTHQCEGCKSYPECPCGDGNCPPHCTKVKKDADMNEEIRDRLRRHAAELREAVKDFDGDAFSSQLFARLGISRPEEESARKE